MLLGYIIHGPTRILFDGLRTYCFVVGLFFVGLLAVYMRRLAGYTRPVEWQGSVRKYSRAWRNHNKRLLGRILLTFALFLAAISDIGTEIIVRWGHDIGYWRLPVNVGFVTIGTAALSYMLLWNSLPQEESPDVVDEPTAFVQRPAPRIKSESNKSVLPWIFATIAFFGFLGFQAYTRSQAPPKLDQSVRCVIAALDLHQQDAAIAHQAEANNQHLTYTSVQDPFAQETVESVRSKCDSFVKAP